MVTMFEPDPSGLIFDANLQVAQVLHGFFLVLVLFPPSIFVLSHILASTTVFIADIGICIILAIPTSRQDVARILP
jgi:hypothetical protein